LTRTSHRWQCKPGSFDTVHARELFPSDNPLGIPTLRHTALSKLPRWLVPYRTRIRSVDGLDDGAVHFFLDDYRFETVWARPFKALEALRPYPTLLTPDFSLYADWPQTVQIWNVYRSRWCGAFWQAQGFTVIPTVSWSNPDSFDFCFLGLEPCGLVAVSSLGIDFRHPLQLRRFMAGFREMVDRLIPSTVLCYGRVPDELHDLVEIASHPTRWQGILKARDHGGKSHGG
jgi:hypothetical protein